jgi:hypothetical protein
VRGHSPEAHIGKRRNGIHISKKSMPMKKNLFVPGLLLIFSQTGISQQAIFQRPLSPRIANYRISVKLDVKKKMLHGSEILAWRNASQDRIKDLQFHLYLNAFKNPESTFMKEGGRRYRELRMPTWGWINVTKMSVRGGEDLTDSIEYISPDDGNPDDETVIRVPLAKPVRPGQTITLDVEFEAQLPSIFSRTGFRRNFYMVAQWFPKIGVYEAAGERYAVKGTWNCHQFHANTEFYADYGVYDVDINVPQKYIVGAVGLLRQEVPDTGGTKTVSFHAEDVHDFSWTASPDFAVVEDRWQDVRIRLLTQQYKLGGISQRYIQSVKVALQHLNDWIGRYPYPNITIVDPPFLAEQAGGMEYPTLITGLSIWGLPHGVSGLPGIPDVEEVTIHEFTHQYWYGLVGNNEFEEAWLDEGFTQYFETRIMDAAYGRKTSAVNFFGFHAGDFEQARSWYTGMKNPKLAPILQPAWEYTAGGYDGFTYAKSAVVLTTLERMIGWPVMDEIMRTYFERWKFKHPCTRDFIAVVNEIVPKYHGKKFGENMNWYFDEVLSGTNVCDYALSSIGVAELDQPGGEPGTKNEQDYVSRVLVSRLGEVILPVDVLIRFDDGKEIRETWDGRARWKQFSYTGRSRVVSATVDPDDDIPLDINRNNNSKTREPSSLPFWKYTMKFMALVQAILSNTLLF